MGTCDRDANGVAGSGDPYEGRVRMRECRGGTACSSDVEVPIKGMEPRRCVKIRLAEETSNGRNEKPWERTSCLSEMTFST